MHFRLEFREEKNNWDILWWEGNEYVISVYGNDRGTELSIIPFEIDVSDGKLEIKGTTNRYQLDESYELVDFLEWNKEDGFFLPDYSVYKPNLKGDIFDVGNSRFNEPGYFTELIVRTDWGSQGSRFFKKENDQITFLGASFGTYRVVSTLESEGGDTLFLTNAWRHGFGDLYRFNINESFNTNPKPMEIGQYFDLAHWHSQRSPDGTKILLSRVGGVNDSETTNKPVNENSFISILDLTEDKMIRLEETKLDYPLTLYNGNTGFLGVPEREARWIDDRTIEYDVYRFEDPEAPFSLENAVEFVESREFSIE